MLQRSRLSTAHVARLGRHQSSIIIWVRFTKKRAESMKIFATLLTIVAFVLAGCASPGETSGGLRAGQWSPVRTIGPDRYLIEGYDIEDALAGGTAHCSKVSKKLDAEKVIPHTQRDRATVTFVCR